MSIEKLEIQDGDIIKMPSDTSQRQLNELSNIIAKLHPTKQILLVAGDISKLTDEDLAIAGLERKKS